MMMTTTTIMMMVMVTTDVRCNRYFVSKKHKNRASSLKGGTSRKKQKSKIATAQTNEDGFFWNEGAELWTDGNMKFLRREAIPSVNAEDRVRYKYVERSLGLNHNEALEVNASIFGATKFGDFALVHPDV